MLNRRRDNTKTTFHYRERIAAENKLIFLGTLAEDSGTEVAICIKSTRSYTQGPHQCCAQFGFAPALRGLEKLAGDFRVVMDELVGYKSLADMA